MGPLKGLYFDRRGREISLDEYGLLACDSSYKRVAIDYIEGRVTISTVWLGLNYGFAGHPPMIFETMVFGGSLDREQYRYSTEEQARAGHAELVTLVRLADLVEQDDQGEA